MFEDVDKVIKADTRGRRRWCSFRNWVNTLDEADRDKAEELVADREYDCRSLARYFQTKGCKANDQVLTRHRNKRCCQVVA